VKGGKMLRDFLVLFAMATTTIAQTQNLSLSHVVVVSIRVNRPNIIYGAASKKTRTADLVYDAVRLGFRGIDTASHWAYNETGVGVALERLYADAIVTREELFVQTKFSAGVEIKDPTLPVPYDVNATLVEQVRQSLQASFRNLRTTYLDSLVLHYPLPTHEQTMDVWRTFEAFVDRGKVLQIGVSNFYDRSELQRLWTEARIKPAVVQNRFSPRTGFDRDLRAFCNETSMSYQAFSSIKENPTVIGSAEVEAIASKYGKTKVQIFIRFLVQMGIVPLMGTSNLEHMRDDLNIFSIQLTDDEVGRIHALLV